MSITVSSGAAAWQAWLDQLDDEIGVDRSIDISRLYGLIGTEASDK